MTKMLYVISDLHIGGDYADATAPAGRGFRLCTNVERLTEFVQSLSRAGNRDSADIELVINGDFVDFLASRDAKALRTERTASIAAFAVEFGGTEFDLDEDLESAAIDELLAIDEAPR